MDPYFYKLRHKQTGKFYIGCQYGKNANSKKLISEYFTSSKVIQEMVKTEGADSFEVERIVETPNARRYERRYLQRMYKMLGRSLFVERFINRNLAPGILMTDKIKNKISKADIFFFFFKCFFLFKKV